MTSTPGAAPIETDAVIVGAGPVGLFQAFELGLLEIRAHIVDSLAVPGGQCVELYADKPIYDIPGIQVLTGRELTANLLKQIEPFKVPMHLNQEVTRVAKRTDGRFDVETSGGTCFVAKTVLVAGGVGSFQPRQLKVEGLEKLRPEQVCYRIPEPAQCAGKKLLIVGGGDEALDAAIQCSSPGSNGAAGVALVHRRDSFNAQLTSIARLGQLREQGAVQFIAGQVAAIEAAAGRLSAVMVLGADGQTRRVAADIVLVRMGVSPKLGPIADWGLALERKQIAVDTEKFETSTPGIFAVGDVNTYPGKKKLILCGFHEAALAAFGVARYVFPEQAIQLQYTTTSTRLHKLLGVNPPTLP
jgi:thioredoxin reductase (NADPH)